MDAIRFKETLVCNAQTNRCIEDHSKALFSYAGVHDRLFDDKLNEQWDDLTAWSGDLGVWSVFDGQLIGEGDGGADWEVLLSVAEMPSEGILSVYKDSTRGGVVFRATDASDHYLFFWDSNSCGFLKCVSGSYSVLMDIPKVFTGEGDIVLSWREMKFRATSDEKWLFMSAWVDGELIGTTLDSMGSPGHKIGFAVYDSDTVIFGAARIPELTEVSEWASLDVGESPASALSRVMGRRHVKYFLRYDGTLRMWRPKIATSTWIYQRHITNFNWNVDYRNLVSHWRQVGAWEEADVLDTGLLEKGITRFHKDNNPDLMTKEACYNEAGYAIQKLKENADEIDMEVPVQVLQEPEDVVTVFFARDGNTIINIVDYIVDLDEAYAIAFQGGTLKTRLQLRKQQ